MKNRIIVIVANILLLSLVVVGCVVKFPFNFILSIVSATALVGANVSFIYLLKNDQKKTIREVKEVNKAKTEYLASLSHGIRTPMQAVIGMTAIAQANVDDKEVVTDALDKINMSGRHLLSLVNDVVDFSKVEQGKFTTDTNIFSLKKQANFLQCLFQSEIDSKKLTFKTNFIDCKYDFVLADELRLNQILINIVSNAVKYTPEGGAVTLNIIQKTISLNHEKVRLIYKVADTGVGMSVDTKEHVFDAYTRAIDSRINQISGSGLGLTITKHLVDLLGGEIFVDSVLGHGTEFTVAIDVIMAPNQRDVVRVDPTTIVKANILVCEDNEINYEIISKTLEPYGITTERAENGLQAVEKVKLARQGQYDLILMDIEMPEMNGYEATKAIREIRDAKLAATPIYAVTANAFSTDVEKAKAAGMNGHISKPIDFSRIRNIIQNNKN